MKLSTAILLVFAVCTLTARTFAQTEPRLAIGDPIRKSIQPRVAEAPLGEQAVTIL